LNVIGAGRVGRVLARLWNDAQIFEVSGILNRSLESGEDAAAFVGAGRAAGSVQGLGRADVTLIAVADDAIGECCDVLVAAGRVVAGDVVFHCSGALDSSVLDSARLAGAATASVHPVMSFADAASALGSFGGTWCGAEGDADALALLKPAFEAIGARIFGVDPSAKAIYHAGAVIACNYLVALIEAGLVCYEEAGVPRDIAVQILRPLVGGTLENVFDRGTVQALTGPIARGEADVIRQQLEALDGRRSDIAALYRALGRATLALARDQGSASREALDRIRHLLDG
jgi:predicted short-subunit dehydrogenase-like oxidoreductase (DUF2520 family)